MDVADATLFPAGRLSQGYAALERGAWADARAQFAAALAEQETPVAHEGLGLAAWWQNDLDAAFAARERAFTLYREAGDPRSAARMAVWLAWDYLGVRLQPAVANGWLQRAHSLLDDLPPGREHGWLLLREAENAILWENDAATAARLAVQGAAIGRAVGPVDLEMYGQALEGLALVAAGDVTAGMRRLDEATVAAVSGEMANRCAVGSTCCCLIFACERVHDYDRAAQWCARLQEYCERTGYVPMLGVCRTHYAGVLIWTGAWTRAEAELATARATLEATRPGMVPEAVAQLGLLRARQGRLDEAVHLLDGVAFFPPAQLGLGAIALELGDPEAALDHATRYLRRIPAGNRADRVGGLELQARACLALGRLDDAASAAAELATAADAFATDPLRAATALIAGLLAAARGEPEPARRHLEDAADLYTRAGAPFEAAGARLALAATLADLGRRPAALREARAAQDAFDALGAARAATRAAALLRRLDPAAPVAPLTARLTARQRDVLRLVAQGLADQEIAARLTLSPHTVHRHITNILARLDVASRAAAVARAVRDGLI